MQTVDDLVAMLNGAMFISKIDLKAAYNQMVITKMCRFITAFCTHLGIFQYRPLNLLPPNFSKKFLNT